MQWGPIDSASLARNLLGPPTPKKPADLARKLAADQAPTEATARVRGAGKPTVVIQASLDAYFFSSEGAGGVAVL